MDENDIIRFWVSISTLSIFAAGFFAVAWHRAAKRARRFEQLLLDRFAPERSAAEVDELRGSIGAIADQVDRLAEGQEFLSRVLAQPRPEALPRSEAARVITPP
jgi:hypothetical protein